MNNFKLLPKTEHERLLNLFPIQYRDKLRIYTGEELYYIYRIATFKASRDEDGSIKSGEVFYLGLKAQVMRYLKGTLDQYFRPCKPIHPNAMGKIGSKFRKDFNNLYSNAPDIDLITEHFNANRVA